VIEHIDTVAKGGFAFKAILRRNTIALTMSTLANMDKPRRDDEYSTCG
jgi:hypothetical protein